MRLQCPTPKILLPIDGSEHSKRAVEFAGCFGASLGGSLAGITLLHVIAGGYLSRHLTYIDFRAEEIIRSDAIRRVKEQYLKEKIMPLMEEGERILRDSGITVVVEKLVVDGDPASEIVRIANEKGFSTIIMGRRGLSEIKGFFLGSVTSRVAHIATRQSVFITGQKVPCPAFKILIPVDGSTYSLKGVEYAACLIREFKDSILGVAMLNVINLALYEESLKRGITPEEEAKRILKEAKEVFLEAGVPEGLLTTRTRMGIPADEIQKEAKEGEYNIIIMGRKGRSFFKDALLGGVSSTVLQRCQEPTVAIVSGE